MWGGRVSSRARVTLGFVVLAVIAIAATFAYGEREVPRQGDPSGLRALLAEGDGGRVVVDTRGRPLLGRDGKPLRVARDGKTLVDSKGRAVRDAKGRAVRISAQGKLPRRALSVLGSPKGERTERRRATKPRRRKKPRPASAARPPVIVGVHHVDEKEYEEGFRVNNAQLDAVNGPAAARAVADYINATGGIGGRRIEVRPRNNVGGGLPEEQAYQAQCAYYKEEKVLAVIGRWTAEPLIPCLSAASITYVGDATLVAQQNFERWGDAYFMPGSMGSRRAMRAWVRALAEAGFFGSGARVGLAWEGWPEHREMAHQQLKPLLDAAGVTLVAQREVAPRSGGEGVPTQLAELSSVSLEFQSKNVDRVMAIDGGGEFTGLFMRAAFAQGFMPRWGLSTGNAPMLLVPNVPREQLRARGGAVGAGWSPIIDVPAQNEPPRTATHDRCDAIYRAAGVSPGDRSPLGQGAAYGFCAELLAIDHAIERSGEATPEGLRRGLNGLGSTFEHPLAMATLIDRLHHDGAAGYRRIAYDDQCNCFRYGGPLVTVD